MESKICKKCSSATFLKNMYSQCENSHITCTDCLRKICKECPYCKADWKKISSKKNEIKIKISPETKYNLDCSDCSSIIKCDGNLINGSLPNPELPMKDSLSNNGAKAKHPKDTGHTSIKVKLLPPASGQSGSNKIYELKFANEEDKKKFETMNSFSSEKQKLQLRTAKSRGQLNNLPNRSPSHGNKKNLFFNELSSNKPHSEKRQVLSVSSTDLDYPIKSSDSGPRRLKLSNKVAPLLRQKRRDLFKTNEAKNKKNVFMVLDQPQKEERSLRVPSNKDVYIRNSNSKSRAKVINKKIDECFKMRRLRREQLIAEEKTMIRQRILQEMQKKLLEKNYKTNSNTSAFSEGPNYTAHSIKGEDIKHESYRKGKLNKTRAARKLEVKSNSNSLTSELKSFYSEKPSSDMSLKKNSYPRVLQEELNLNLTTPKSSPRPSYKCMQQTTNNKDDLLKQFNSKCDLTLDTETSLRTNSSTEAASCEMTVLSPTSEKSYDKYSLSRTVHHNYKDSSTEPIPSWYFHQQKLCCTCSCDKICNNERILKKFSKSEMGDISQKNSSDDVETNELKSNTNINKNLKKESSIEDSPSTEKSGETVILNTNQKNIIEIHLKENEKSTIDEKNNFDKAVKFEIGDYDRVGKHLDKELETPINEVLTINDNNTTSQKSKSRISINDELKSCADEIDTQELRVQHPETNVFTVMNRLTNSWQAFSPSIDTSIKQSLEPTPQVRMIQIRHVNDEIRRLQQTHSILRLFINRKPLNCPITTCKSKVFISEFAKHIKLNHVQIVIETISPGVCKNLYCDCKLIRSGLSSCQILYLVTNKIRDFGNHEFRDLLPVLLMTTKASLFDLFCSSQQHKQLENVRNKQYYYFIWLTGFVIKEVPVYYTLIAWNRKAARTPGCHVVNSGKLHSFRESQTAQDLYKTGQALILTQEQCDMLTDDGKNMLELQIILH